MDSIEERVVREAQDSIKTAMDSLKEKVVPTEYDLVLMQRLTKASVLLDTILPIQKPPRKRRTKAQMEEVQNETL